MNTSKYNKVEMVLVPQSDIDKLEKARLYLHELIELGLVRHGEVMDITSPMYEITHRKYPTITSNE